MDRALYGKKRVVLVIDSDPAEGARLKRILNKYGYRVYIPRIRGRAAVTNYNNKKRG